MVVFMFRLGEADAGWNRGRARCEDGRSPDKAGNIGCVSRVDLKCEVIVLHQSCGIESLQTTSLVVVGWSHSSP